MLYTIWTSPFPFILSSSSRLASVDTIWKWRRLKRLHCGPWQGLSSDSMQIKSVLCAFSCWGNAPIQSHGAGGQPSFWFLIRDRGLSGVRAGGSGGLSELEICLSGWNRLEVTSSGTVGFGSGMRAKLTWCVVNHSRCKAQGDCFANDDSRVEVAALFSQDPVTTLVVPRAVHCKMVTKCNLPFSKCSVSAPDQSINAEYALEPALGPETCPRCTLDHLGVTPRRYSISYCAYCVDLQF